MEKLYSGRKENKSHHLEPKKVSSDEKRYCDYQRVLDEKRFELSVGSFQTALRKPSPRAEG